jgi:hypothetical protein
MRLRFGISPSAFISPARLGDAHESADIVEQIDEQEDEQDFEHA